MSDTPSSVALQPAIPNDALGTLPGNVILLVLNCVPKYDWNFLRGVSRFWRDQVNREVISLTPHSTSMQYLQRFPKLQRMYLKMFAGPVDIQALQLLVSKMHHLKAIQVQPQWRPIHQQDFELRQLTQLVFHGSKLPRGLRIVIPDLHSLHLHSCNFYLDSLVEGLSGVAALTSLKLISCKMIAGDERHHTWNLLKPLNTGRLRSLSLSGSMVPAERSVYQVLADFTSLTELNLSNNLRIADRFGITSLNALTNLKSLDVSTTIIDVDGLALLTALTGLLQLEAIDFRTSRTHALRDVLFNFPKLRQLNISGYADVQNESLLSLTNLTSVKILLCRGLHGLHLSGLKLLQELHAGGEGLTDKLLESLTALTNLRVLELSHDQHARILGKGYSSLGRLICLRRLSLSPLQSLRDEHLSALLSITKLTYLDLTCCMRVTTAGVRQLEVLPLVWLHCWACRRIVPQDLPQKLQLAVCRGKCDIDL